MVLVNLLYNCKNIDLCGYLNRYRSHIVGRACLPSNRVNYVSKLLSLCGVFVVCSIYQQRYCITSNTRYYRPKLLIELQYAEKVF